MASSLTEARQQMVLRAPDVVLLDLMLPDGNGMELFPEVDELADSDIVLITGHASLETSSEALRLGAANYLVKPINLRQLKGVLARVRPPGEIKTRIASLEKDVGTLGRFGRLWGRSEAMQQVYRQIGRVAGTAVNVLVTGESGTGKEFVAITIHHLSRRRERALLAVNCGAISPQLIESEMFGHEKGSFTSAARQHRGYFERADGGTLLLNEITEMPLDLQVKLLRILETGSFLRIGGDELVETDVRVIAATNCAPREAVTAGKLREDLFYRLNAFEIRLPALRERLEDVPLLANHFLSELNARDEGSKHLSPVATEALTTYHWPGNVRQLLSAMQRAYIMAKGDVIDADALSFEASHAAAEPVPSGTCVSVKIGTPIAEMERRLIYATLEHCGGRREKAAELLGVSPKTLYNRMREYERVPRGRGR